MMESSPSRRRRNQSPREKAAAQEVVKDDEAAQKQTEPKKKSIPMVKKSGLQTAEAATINPMVSPAKGSQKEIIEDDGTHVDGNASSCMATLVLY